MIVGFHDVNEWEFGNGMRDEDENVKGRSSGESTRP
jgi:hypothetical protein